MSVQAVRSYSVNNEEGGPEFTLGIIDFDQACVANEDQFVNSFNIIWIKEGKATYHVDLKHFDLKDETIFFLNPGQVFAVKSESIRKGYRISFVSDFYCIETKDKETACNGLLFNNIYELPYITPGPRVLTDLEHIVGDMICEFEEPGTAHKELIRTYLKLLLIKATRVKKEATPNTGFIEDEDHELFRKFSLLVEKHFRQLHSVQDYAELLHVSPKSLTKKFHQLKQRPPLDLIRGRIVMEAKRELIYSDRSVKEIAFNLGFVDPAYFNRFFKKATSLAPNTFKDAYLQT